MILYHGSNIEISRIDLSKSRPFKDFGRGFYLSDTEYQALEMARFKVSIFGGRPVVNRFEFDEAGMLNSGLKIKRFEVYDEEWLDFVIANRDGSDVERFDFVYGPIADDRVGLQLQRYHDGTIRKDELLRRLRYSKGVTFQYFFGTEHSLKFLKAVCR